MDENKANQILKSIPDPTLRKHVANIITGKIVKQVRCMSKECKGRVVANILADGKVQPVSEYGKMYLRAHRPRLDNYLGFQCWCGNDSRICKEEEKNKGIENNALTPQDIEDILLKVQKNKPNYPEKDGKQLIDNFLVERI